MASRASPCRSGSIPEPAVDHLKFADGRTLMREELIERGPAGRIRPGIEPDVRGTAPAGICGHCGAATVSEAGGYRRQCTSCDTALFSPHRSRRDHADGRCRAAIAACWAARRISSPACIPAWPAFSSRAKPSKRQSAARRSRNRASSVGAVRYHASQPWPMPHSLMIGCYGRAESLDIRVTRRNSRIAGGSPGTKSWR